jgi:hypothetical protein
MVAWGFILTPLQAYYKLLWEHSVDLSLSFLDWDWLGAGLIISLNKCFRVSTYTSQLPSITPGTHWCLVCLEKSKRTERYT